MRALVMAGGEGRRLHPLTHDLPKPLLQVGGKPILEHLLGHLRCFGVNHVTLAVGHLASKIMSHFGSGSGFGLDISYVQETSPLGTAGALSLISDDFNEPFFVTNGDILTDLNFQNLMLLHRCQRATLTVASKVRHTSLSLGVLDLNEAGQVAAYREKPCLEHRVGLGIYVIDPVVRTLVPSNRRLDMPDLINGLISAQHTVASYEHKGNWADIGTLEEYSQIEDQSWVSSIVKQPSDQPSRSAS